ncbi:thioredoxin-disulfide reductase [Chitinivibrio alkaliphilus]|uniref:Thioredoxin reductase n=1 Tax=Chitinivibrio alkaliphilus ACht1 TaxID=1313304 RepID=U7DA58_9BACT|nr:thioredoxin-disulfide reductase [Chitinivibrio alkaliphilus]ERP32007.1 thioredoxin-disulfide reductase [Chitinivibrio alkaliphilus ACht1]
MTTKEEELIIIGSGPAGLTAAIYAARANLSPLLFEGFMSGGMPGGQLMETNDVENFPGYPEPVQGPALMGDLKKQAERAGTRFIMEDIEKIEKENDHFILTSMNEDVYRAKAVIIATGAKARRLPLASEKTFWGKGISACAICDGALPMFRDQPIAVVGGGEAAIEEATYLTQFAQKVYIIHRRDAFRATAVMTERALSNEKIEVLWNSVVDEFLGGDTLEKIVLKNTQNGERSTLHVKGCFEAIGHIPNTKLVEDLLATDDQGYIQTYPDSTKTEVSGLFAAGDVQDKKYKQAITSAGSGCMAALDAEKYITETFGR